MTDLSAHTPIVLAYTIYFGANTAFIGLEAI